jgi:hypothetical protein
VRDGALTSLSLSLPSALPCVRHGLSPNPPKPVATYPRRPSISPARVLISIVIPVIVTTRLRYLAIACSAVTFLYRTRLASKPARPLSSSDRFKPRHPRHPPPREAQHGHSRPRNTKHPRSYKSPCRQERVGKHLEALRPTQRAPIGRPLRPTESPTSASMNTPADQMWSQAPESLDTMAPMTGNLDDLSNIFNIDDFNLDNLPDIDTNGFGDQMPQSHPGTHPSTPFDENMGQLGAPPGTAAQDFGGHNGFVLQGSMNAQQQFEHQSMVSMPYGPDSMYQPSMQQTYPQQHQQSQQQNFNFNQHQQQQYPSSHQVPPTPNSLDLNGEAGRFMQQQMDAQQRAMLEHQYQMRKEQQVQFTPMASPSTTPYHLHPDFTVPGDFFSPLTSPALHAQNASQAHHQFVPQLQGYYTNPSTATSSAAPSPIDRSGDVEMGGDGLSHPESATQTKKPSRRKPATPRTFALNKVKQSPIQKPHKRKSIALSQIDADAVVQDAQRPGQMTPRSAGFQMPPTLESSENESVSPEALNDNPMGPPPRPGSVHQSPAIVARNKGVTGPAATPKSLLSMKSVYDANGPGSSGISGQMGQASLEDLELPEAADGEERQPSGMSTIQSSNSQEQTPRLTASRKTPKLGPMSTPSSSRAMSISGSPAISPMTASTPAGLLKDRKDSKGARGTSKKRGSICTTSSALASPALRPKVSPSIKPLLPEGSKSCSFDYSYQNNS